MEGEEEGGEEEERGGRRERRREEGEEEGEEEEKERRYVFMNYIRTDIRSLCYSEADSGKISFRQTLSAASTPAEAANHE